ncbi:MAG: hypothetical protein DRN42_03770 [Thermoplasmata archaeon]|nr:MAG: hypothetical protein DRN42_03770 [Thermoplasmata archaeon]
MRGDITSDSSVYLGERVKVLGKLVVEGDLEVGEGVVIDPEKVESRGWIEIKNPIPLIIYIFIYLMELLRRGEEGEVERIIQELVVDEETFLIQGKFLFLPRGGRISSQRLTSPGDVVIGPEAKIVGSVVSGGSVVVNEAAEVFGSIRAEEDVILRKNTVVHGEVEARGEVLIDSAARIQGDVAGRLIRATQDTIVGGKLRAEEGVELIPAESKEIEEKLRRFEIGLDLKEAFLEGEG